MIDFEDWYQIWLKPDLFLLSFEMANQTLALSATVLI
jgi:hypothetical protein